MTHATITQQEFKAALKQLALAGELALMAALHSKYNKIPTLAELIGKELKRALYVSWYATGNEEEVDETCRVFFDKQDLSETKLDGICNLIFDERIHPETRELILDRSIEIKLFDVLARVLQKCGYDDSEKSRIIESLGRSNFYYLIQFLAYPEVYSLRTTNAREYVGDMLESFDRAEQPRAWDEHIRKLYGIFGYLVTNDIEPEISLDILLDIRNSLRERGLLDMSRVTASALDVSERLKCVTVIDKYIEEITGNEDERLGEAEGRPVIQQPTLRGPPNRNRTTPTHLRQTTLPWADANGQTRRVMGKTRPRPTKKQTTS